MSICLYMSIYNCRQYCFGLLGLILYISYIQGPLLPHLDLFLIASSNPRPLSCLANWLPPSSWGFKCTSHYKQAYPTISLLLLAEWETNKEWLDAAILFI